MTCFAGRLLVSCALQFVTTSEYLLAPHIPMYTHDFCSELSSTSSTGHLDRASTRHPKRRCSGSCMQNNYVEAKALLLAHIHCTFSLATRTGRSLTRMDSQGLEMKLTANYSSQLSDQLSSARFAYQSRVSERSRTATNGGCKDSTSN